MNIMKRIIAIILLTVMIIPILTSCKSSEVTYDPVPSTEEEARVIMTLTYNGRTYDVKYELYRALFLNLKDEVSGGDDSVWTGDRKDEYIEKINSLIIARITHIYLVFALCDEIGYNLYSPIVDVTVKKYIKASVEGSESLTGHGSYSAYLEALKKMNLNYSVQDLLLRYSIGQTMLDAVYLGAYNPETIGDTVTFDGVTYTREQILEFYFSDDCIRTLRAEINPDAHYNPDERAETVRLNMVDAATRGEGAVALVIIGSSATAASEVENGYLLTRYTLDSLYFSELTDKSFALSIGEVSEPIKIQGDNENTIYIVYRAEKSFEHFNNCYSDVVTVFLADALGKMTEGVSSDLEESLILTDAYYEIVHSEISMD